MPFAPLEAAASPSVRSRPDLDTSCVCPQTPQEREALYAELKPLILGLIRRYARDPEMQRDLQGEIYCHFHRLLEVYEPKRRIPLRAYLIRQLTVSVYSTCRVEWRYQARHVLLEGHEKHLAYSPTQEWDETLYLTSLCARLPQALEALTERQYRVVVWRYYHALSYDEISIRLNIKPATARSLLRHSLNRLRQVLYPSLASPQESPFSLPS